MPPLTDIKILVVDDREDNLLSIETILESENYTIIKATSGRGALKALLKEHNFSLILMDVQMPDMNGFETASLIYERDKLKDIPIIFITAHSYEDEAMFKGYRLGAVDYIYKPINPELLRAKVAVFVDLYRKNYELLEQEKSLLAANASLQKEIEDRIISEQKIRELNEQLLMNNNHLKAVNEELDRFAYVASHDLQEPLRKITIFTDIIMQKKFADDDALKYFQKIIDSTQRMKQLINDLLRFSQHYVHGSDFIETDLSSIVKEAIAELEVKIAQSNTVIEMNELPTLWVIPGLMRQVFYNLISNAIKFRKQSEPPVVRIYAENFIKPDARRSSNYYKICISDNGIGFDTKYKDEVFVAFKRLHSYHEIEGTGIGLSICKKIIEKHDGVISVDSVENSGSTFSIELPEKRFN